MTSTLLQEIKYLRDGITTILNKIQIVLSKELNSQIFNILDKLAKPSGAFDFYIEAQKISIRQMSPLKPRVISAVGSPLVLETRRVMRAQFNYDVKKGLQNAMTDIRSNTGNFAAFFNKTSDDAFSRYLSRDEYKKYIEKQTNGMREMSIYSRKRK